jgi:two-component system heavy metal sensor histidine kinase CusS
LALPHPEPLDLAKEVGELFDFYEALADSREIRLELEGRGGLTGDRLMLRRAVGNLLANAVTYSSFGTAVRVSLEERDGGLLRIVVASRGETLAPERLPKLFDRFYRMDAARERSSDGAGLGLAITRSIIQAHGGSITVQSAQGLTQFIVLLPRAGK